MEWVRVVWILVVGLHTVWVIERRRWRWWVRRAVVGRKTRKKNRKNKKKLKKALETEVGGEEEDEEDEDGSEWSGVESGVEEEKVSGEEIKSAVISSKD